MSAKDLAAVAASNVSMQYDELCRTDCTLTMDTDPIQTARCFFCVISSLQPFLL